MPFHVALTRLFLLRPKMCYKIPAKSKAIVTEFLPPGWTFYFRPERSESGKYGLVIESPRGARYFSFNNAMKHNQGAFSGFTLEAFHEYAGLFGEDTDEPETNQKASITVKLKNSCPPKGADLKTSIGTYSPRDLYKKRCGKCKRCKMPDCGICSSCLNNNTYSRRFREVCLKKVSSKCIAPKRLQMHT